MGRITEHYLERNGGRCLLRLVVEGSGVLDVVTEEATLRSCRALLSEPRDRPLERRLGSFGPFTVTLSLTARSQEAAIMLDGPDLDHAFQGGQAAGLYVDAQELAHVLAAHLASARQDQELG